MEPLRPGGLPDFLRLIDPQATDPSGGEIDVLDRPAEFGSHWHSVALSTCRIDHRRTRLPKIGFNIDPFSVGPVGIV